MENEILFIRSESMSVSYIPGKGVAICRATARFIPEEEFRLVFTKIEDLVLRERIRKLIFDKSALKIFHQPSMTWYHVEWKVRMARFGLKVHRKILPQDLLFVKSVEIGRDKIARENPSFRFEDFDIQYCKSVDEALAK